MILPAPPDHWLPNQFQSLIGDAMAELAAQLHVRPLLLSSFFLGTASVPIQQLFDLKFNGSIVPANVSTITLAGPGQGKSIGLKLVAKPLFEENEKRRDKNAPASRTHARDFEIWETRKKGLLRKLKLADDTQTVDAINAELLKHYEVEPKLLSESILFYEVISGSALESKFNEDDACIAIMSGEAGQLKSLFERWSLLNNAMDGSIAETERTNRKPIHRRSCRFVSTLAMQPKSYASLLASPDLNLQGSGFCARMLHAESAPIIGGDGGLRDLRVGPRLAAFHRRIEELIQQSSSAKSKERHVIELDSRAANWCHSYSREVEQMTQPGWPLHHVPDFASRLIEHTVSVATVLHAMTQPKGDISQDTLFRAFNIVKCYANEYARIFSPETKIARHAEKIERFLQTMYIQGYRSVTWRFMQHGGPEPRKQESLEPAIMLLQQAGKVSVYYELGTRKTRMIALHDSLAPLVSMQPRTDGIFNWNPSPIRQY